MPKFSLVALTGQPEPGSDVSITVEGLLFSYTVKKTDKACDPLVRIAEQINASSLSGKIAAGITDEGALQVSSRMRWDVSVSDAITNSSTQKIGVSHHG